MSLRKLAWKIYLGDRAQRMMLRWIGLTGRDRKVAERYLAGNHRKGLHIGAGDNIRSGWLNTNWFPIAPRTPRAIFLDATKPFPFPDDAFDFIFTEHMIEHVPIAAGRAMLGECYRVLKPGGTIRISTPDMAFLVALLSGELTPLQQSYVAWAAGEFLHNGEPHTPLAVVNNFVRDWGHTFIYDRATLESVLRGIGYTAIERRNVDESPVAELRGIDHPERFPDPDFLDLETMVYEASKPRSADQVGGGTA